MENQELNLFNLRIDESCKMNLKSTATWATVIVVCSIIGFVLSIFELLKPAPNIVISEADNYAIRASKGENATSVVITLIIGIVLLVFLYNFARYVKKGVETSSMSDLSKGFLNLKNYFLVISILFILGILFVLIILAFVGSMA